MSFNACKVAALEKGLEVHDEIRQRITVSSE